MWIYTHHTLMMRNRLSDEVSGEYRAVLELAAAMQAELDIEDFDSTMLREKQLKERIDKELQGGAVAYAYPDSKPNVYSIREGLRTWFKNDKWWFLAMFMTTVFCSTVWMVMMVYWESWYVWVWVWTWSIWIGQFCAFCVGTTAGSRLLIILFWSVLGGAIMSTVSGVTARRGW